METVNAHTSHRTIRSGVVTGTQYGNRWLQICYALFQFKLNGAECLDYINKMGRWIFFMSFFNSISLISERSEGENEKLCIMEPRY